jgi:hypothetical protein
MNRNAKAPSPDGLSVEEGALTWQEDGVAEFTLSMPVLT